MAHATLTKREILHMRRLWYTAKSIYETEGGGLQSLGLLLNSLAVLHRKEDPDNGWAGQWTDRPGAKTNLTIPRLATDIGIAVVLLISQRIKSPHLLQNYLVCDAALRLLLEVITRPMPMSLQTEMRMQTHALLHLLQICHTDFHDFCGAWMLNKSFISNVSSPLVESETKMEELIENRLGVFCSPHFVVPLHEHLLPPDSILGCYHDAKMTGSALDADALQRMRSATCIVDVAGSTAFATLHSNNNYWADGGITTCIWHFTPCRTGVQSRKTKATVLHELGGPHRPRAGALYKGRLWLTEFDGTFPGDIAGYSVRVEQKNHVWMKKRPGPMKDHVGFSMVACGERFVIFGGLNNDGTIGNFGSINGIVYYISAEDGYASDIYRRAPTRAPGGNGPAARLNHAAWSDGKYMYIFGGMSREPPAEGVLFYGAKSHRLAPLNDLWRLDTETWKWERLEPCGLRPCPRHQMGVANRGPDTYIVGGLAQVAPRNSQGKHGVLLLHDIWHYQAEEDCWVQVLPAKDSKAWMSARRSPACAVLDSGHLAVLGGFDADGNSVGMGVCLTIDVRDGGAIEVLQAPMEQGFSAPDTAMLLAQSYMEQRLDSGNERRDGSNDVVNPRLIALLDSPAGAAVFLTRFPQLLGDAFVRPDNSLLEESLRLIPGLLGPAITLTADLHNSRWTFGDVFWCSGGCPFGTAPRWLGWPSEAFVNQCTESGTAWVTHMTQVVKSFGTAKAASEYFSMVQPSPRFTELFWSYMGCTLLPHAKEDLRFDEVEVYSRFTGPLGSIQAGQLYIAGSMGRYFTCVHVTLLVPKGVHFQEAALPFLTILHILMADVVSRPSQPISCASCGRGDSLDDNERRTAVKVCKGCRLVRYCSAECQAAAWPQHREHCRRYRRPHNDGRGDPSSCPAEGQTSSPEPLGTE